MPIYRYLCEQNDIIVEAIHSFDTQIEDWGALCRVSGRDPGDTPLDSPVKRLVSAPNLSIPKTNADLKNMGFTKLVKRDSGVYENVTRTDGESRYMKADDPSTFPDLKKKIGD